MTDQAAAVVDKPTIDTPSEGDKAPAEFMSDVVNDFEAMDAGKPPPEPKPKPEDKPVSKPDKPEDSTPKPADKPTEKPAEQPDDKIPEGKPVKAAALREAYEGLKKRLREEIEPETQRLRARVQELEAGDTGNADAVKGQLQQLQQRNEELENRIAFLNYQESKEFRDKYAQPYNQAWEEAVSEFKELTIREPAGEDEETGEMKFRERPADEKDLLRLANMKLSEMDAAANAMFGHSASRAIGHIQNIRRLSAAQHKALDDAKNRAKEMVTKNASEFEGRSRSLAETWNSINASLHEKYPQAFVPEEGNADDKAMHTKGFALADLLFLGEQGLSPEQIETLPTSFKETIRAKKPLSDSQKVQLHALARLKMANHDRKVVALKKANARIQELEKALKEYEDSGNAGKPGDAGARDQGPVDLDEQVAAEIKALDK